MTSSRNWIYILLISIVFIASCRGDVVFEEFNRIPEAGWDTDSSVVLEASLSDTTHYHDIYLIFRTNGDYPFSNFYCGYRIISPSKEVISDRKNTTVARNDGKWLGSGMGDLRNFKVLIQRDFIAREAGTYRIELQQKMRKKVLPGIRDAGILIEKGDEVI